MHSYSRRKMGVSGLLDALDALDARKDPCCPLDRKLDRPQSRCGCVGKILPWRKPNPGHPASCVVNCTDLAVPGRVAYFSSQSTYGHVLPLASQARCRQLDVVDTRTDGQVA
jgi:hypothetical protein